MRDTLSSACKAYSDYYDMIKKAFRKERVHLYAPCAGILLGKNAAADQEMFQNTWQVIKAHDEGMFSTVRGAGRIGLVAMTMVCKNQEQRSQDFRTASKVLRQSFPNSQYLPISAMILAESADKENYEELVKKAKELYVCMRNAYPINTYEEEVLYSVLLAMAGKTKDEFQADLTEYMNFLKGAFKTGAGVLDLALILMLVPGEKEEKCKKVIDIYQGLKDKGVKYSVERELAALGALTAYPATADQMVGDLVDVYTELGKRREYGLLGIDKKFRILHAGIIVEAEYRRSEEAKDPACQEIVEKIYAELFAEKLEEVRSQKLAEAKASLKEGEVLEVEAVSEEDVVVEKDPNYHPPMKDLLFVLAAQQASLAVALKNKAGAVSSYATAAGK